MSSKDAINLICTASHGAIRPDTCISKSFALLKNAAASFTQPFFRTSNANGCNVKMLI